MKSPSLAGRALSVTAGIAVAGTLAAAGWHGYQYLAGRPVERVFFGGDTARIAASDLRALAASVRGMTSIAAMRARARQVPWVRDAEVRRQFPDAVEIDLEAYDVIARWGNDALLSSRGEVFRAPFEGDLPRVRAPDAMAPLLARDLAAVQAAARPIESPIAEITVSARGAWHVALASGLALEIGRSDIAARVQRFAAAWPALVAAGTQTNHADLRYANGFALRRVADVQVPKSAARPAVRIHRPVRQK